MSSIMKLSICIPTYNRAYLLRNCLSSICECIPSDLDFEVCISDNASTDDTVTVDLSPLKTKLSHGGFDALGIKETAPGVISNSIGVILVLSQIVWFLAPVEDL